MGERKEDSKPTEKKHLLNMSEVSLTLDSYDDIFSDFDPRVYHERGISFDLLAELKRATREKVEGRLHLSFIIPRDKRNWEDEETIKNRLHSHFKKNYIQLLDNLTGIKRKGIFMAIAGMLMIVCATYISYSEFASFFWHFLIIVLEPAGWFTAWTGLDEIYYTVREHREDLEFNEKMSNAHIEFLSY